MDIMDEYLTKETKELYQHLSKQTEALRKEIAARKTNVQSTLEKYQIPMKNFGGLCDTIMSSIQQLSYGEDHVKIDTSEEHRQHIKQKYGIDRLKNLSSEQNIDSIDKSF
jgi:hypothetical protein